MSQPALWKRFSESTDKFNIYIHNKTDFKGDFSKYCINNRIQTEWGGLSLVKATILLFKEAIRDNENQYFVLLSYTCIPLYSAQQTYDNILETNNNIIYSYKQKISRQSSNT